MTTGIHDIVGRTITGVMSKEGTSPKAQVFLLFSDGTYYELYSLVGRIEGLSHVYRGNSQVVRALQQETIPELNDQPPFEEMK